MGKIGSGIDRNLNEANFSEPIPRIIPRIGLYVAAAPLVCAIAMAVDVIRGFSKQNFWFPRKFVSINATSLTVIAVAVKLSMDLNTAMPCLVDQLAKLSSMPSLRTMDNNEILKKYIYVIALGILAVVYIGIQLSTGMIYLYRKEHVFIMFLMLILLVILSFSALTVTATKTYLEAKFSKKFSSFEKQKILKILDRKPMPSLSPDRMASIDRWRSLNNVKVQLPLIPSPPKSSTTLCTSSEVNLTID